MITYTSVGWRQDTYVAGTGEGDTMCGSCHSTEKPGNITSSGCAECGLQIHHTCDLDASERKWHCHGCRTWG